MLLFPLAEDPPIIAEAEIFLLVLPLPQMGHFCLLSASANETVFSKSLPQLLQEYSYKGINYP